MPFLQLESPEAVRPAEPVPRAQGVLVQPEVAAAQLVVVVRVRAVPVAVPLEPRPVVQAVPEHLLEVARPPVLVHRSLRVDRVPWVGHLQEWWTPLPGRSPAQ